MRIYRFLPDSDRFHSIVTSSPAADAILEKFDGGRLQGKASSSLRFEVTPGDEQGDFPSLYGAVPVLSKRAWDLLSPILNDHVQGLPVALPSLGLHYVLNVTTVVDHLDEARSEISRFPTGRVLMVDSYAFRRSATPLPPMYKLPQTRKMETLVTDLFRDEVAKHSLLGLQFKELGQVPDNGG